METQEKLCNKIGIVLGADKKARQARRLKCKVNVPIGTWRI